MTDLLLEGLIPAEAEGEWDGPTQEDWDWYLSVTYVDVEERA